MRGVRAAHARDRINYKTRMSLSQACRSRRCGTAGKEAVLTGHRPVSIFKPARRRLVYQDIVGQIQEAILDGRLPDGCRLPSDAELMRRFKTSALSVRLALRVLEDRGMITLIDRQSRSGAGGRVCSRPSPGRLPAIDLMLHMKKLSLDQLAEFRASVEGHVASLAARKARDDDLRRLYHLTEDNRQSISCGSLDAFIASDRRVHEALADITGNPLYIHIIQGTHRVQGYFERYRGLRPSGREANYKDLRAVVDAVRAREPGRAEALARRHVHKFNTFLAGPDAKNLI